MPGCLSFQKRKLYSYMIFWSQECHEKLPVNFKRSHVVWENYCLLPIERDIPLELFVCVWTCCFLLSVLLSVGLIMGYFQTSISRCFSRSQGISEWHFPSGPQAHLTDLPDCPTSVLWGPDQALWLWGSWRSWPVGSALFHSACSPAKNSYFKGHSRGKGYGYQSVAWHISSLVIW